MRQQWFTHVRLPVAYLAPLTAGLSVSLTTPALDQRRIRWFGTPDCSATPEDLPPSLAQHGSSQRSSTSLPLPFQDTRRNPEDFGSNRASHSGSNALTTRACKHRSTITGMPSGRRFPVLPLFGMYTRLTGRACHGSVLCCTQSTSSTLAAGSNTTFPSTPAVLRPALRSVTRRTLRSVLARDRSINFCKLRTLLRSPACDAVKIRCRKRRTSSPAVRQSIASQSRRSSSGPFTTTAAPGNTAVRPVMASNLSFGSGVVVIVTAQAHLTRVSTLSGRAPPYPASYPGRSTEGPTGVPVSCCLSATGIRFSGDPLPAGELGLPHGRLTGRNLPSGP